MVKLWSLSTWIDFLLQAIQFLQDTALRTLAWLGLASNSHGQPAWPFSHRLSGDVLLIDHGVARALLQALSMSALALALLVLAVLWRRTPRALPVLLATAATLAVLAPWPDTHLLLAPATPTSFHASQSGFSASAIVQGQKTYQQYCVSCHGIDGKGNTPLALSLHVTPPNLASGLLWRRADGDLFWHISHGMRAVNGSATMQGYAQQLSDRDIWQLIDFMKANAAGTGIQDNGSWPWPVALPALTARCGDRKLEEVNHWRGQRIRIVLANAAQTQALPFDDPRVRSVLVAPAPLSPVASTAGAPAIDCVASSATAWQALAIITGSPPETLAGSQLLTDRDGWLRARKLPAKPGKNGDGWSEADIVCRAPVSAGNADGSSLPGGMDGLDQLIAALDREPVYFVKGGFVHMAQ